MMIEFWPALPVRNAASIVYGESQIRMRTLRLSYSRTVRCRPSSRSTRCEDTRLPAIPGFLLQKTEVEALPGLLPRALNPDDRRTNTIGGRPDGCPVGSASLPRSPPTPQGLPIREERILGKEKAGGSSPPVGSIPSFDARRPMTRWRGGFRPPNGHHHPQHGGGHVSQSHEDVEPGHMHLGGTLPGGTYEHPALDPQVDKLPPAPRRGDLPDRCDPPSTQRGGVR